MKLTDGLAMAMRRGEGGDYTVNISMISRAMPTEPTGYSLIEMATERGWIAERKALRPGLERILLSPDAKDASGWRFDKFAYYIATNQIGPDGLPPVAKCNHSHPKNSGGTGFTAPNGFRVGASWNQRHCLGFPEINQEFLRIYSMLERVGP